VQFRLVNVSTSIVVKAHFAAPLWKRLVTTNVSSLTSFTPFSGLGVTFPWWTSAWTGHFAPLTRYSREREGPGESDRGRDQLIDKSSQRQSQTREKAAVSVAGREPSVVANGPWRMRVNYTLLTTGFQHRFPRSCDEGEEFPFLRKNCGERVR
jgi:hypothetical protein